MGDIELGTSPIDERIHRYRLKAAQARAAADQSAFTREDFLRVAHGWEALANYFMAKELGRPIVLDHPNPGAAMHEIEKNGAGRG